MIAHLKGILKTKATDHIIVDCQGIGYQVSVSLNTFYELPPETMELSLHIHTHIREDQWSLFGFLTMEEKALFQLLLKVNGIGPKLALALLSGFSPYDLTQAIAHSDSQLIQKIPGIGQKAADRIIVDLKSKILKGDVPLSRGTSPNVSASQTYDQALSALTHLGYTRPQAEHSLAQLNWEKGLGLQEAIKQGLKNLARG